jgi:hypothetical protein
MQFVDALLNYLRAGVNFIFDLVHRILAFFFAQFSGIPWANFGGLPFWKQIIIIVAFGAAVYYLYKTARDLIRATEGLLTAVVSALGVFVKAMAPVLIVAVGLALVLWIVRTVNISWLP